MSGLGKGISISSLGVLLKAAGLRVTAIKIDPYLVSDWLPRLSLSWGGLAVTRRANVSARHCFRLTTVPLIIAPFSTRSTALL